MLTRTWHLLRARLAMARRGGWPIPALVFLAVLGAALALLVRDALPAFPYALLALSVGTLLLALPLLSDLGALLRHDEGAEWVGALPALAAERTLARLLHLLALLGALVLAWSLPWAVLAPPEFGALARVALPVLCFALTLFLGTLLLWAQQLFLARLQSAFVALETGTVGLVVVGLVQLLGHLPELALLGPDSPGMAWYPPAWFVRPLQMDLLETRLVSALLPLALAAASLATLARLPAGEARPRRRREFVAGWLEPLRALAWRFWVRADERGPFELVYTALPREREVALRTYPMLGIPLAFLLISATSAHAEGDPWRRDLLALLLFTVGVYLPLLLTHVPLSESPQAAWILQTAPVSASARTGGAIKALFVRWLVPLYLALLVLGLVLGEFALLARLWLPALALALVLLRLLYASCVKDPPLSIAPEELRSEVDWAGQVATLAVGLTLLAVLANRTLGWVGGLGAALGLVLVEVALEWRLRRSPGGRSRDFSDGRLG